MMTYYSPSPVHVDLTSSGAVQPLMASFPPVLSGIAPEQAASPLTKNQMTNLLSKQLAADSSAIEQAESQAIGEAAQGGYAPDLWQVSPPMLGHPSTGIGVLLAGLGIAVSSLWVRLHRLKMRIRQRDQRLRTVLEQDLVTGLANRRGFCEQGEQLLRELSQTVSFDTSLSAKRPNIAVLTLGLEGFQTINNGLGHRAGDQLLVEVGQRLQQHLGPSDMLARTGNDEFSLLLCPADIQRALYLAELILDDLSQPFGLQDQAVVISGRIGISISSPSQLHDLASRPSRSAEGLSAVNGLSLTFGQLFCQAEIARSSLKTQHSRRRYQLFQPEMADQRRCQLQLGQQLRKAIVRQELVVEYQPIVNLKTLKTQGFEALVRWDHAERGRLYPDRFLPLAERLDLIVDIDRWVMTQACYQLVSWAGLGLFPSISVNLSGSHLIRPDLASWVQQLLNHTQVDPRQLTLEVTEGVLIENPRQVSETLCELRQMGVKVSLDDFGTGFSSLSYLNQLSIDTLKIDQSFIRQMSHGHWDEGKERADVIVESVLSLAAELGIDVVAEGVEHEDQCSRLARLNCKYGQGHWFAHSMNGDRAFERLSAEQQMTVLIPSSK